jgi:DNA-binding NtrC family response regulator
MVRRAAQEKRPYDMAFVDVRMPPGMDGVQTIAELRKIDPAMGFVICTAYSDYTPEEAGQKVGLSNGLMFIVKPFDAGIVRQLAQRLCGRVTTAKAG